MRGTSGDCAVRVTVDSAPSRWKWGVGFDGRAPEPTPEATLRADETPQKPPGSSVGGEDGRSDERAPSAGRAEFRPGFNYIGNVAKYETVQAAYHTAYAGREPLS